VGKQQQILNERKKAIMKIKTGVKAGPQPGDGSGEPS
jgi:hypothetical protein